MGRNRLFLLVFRAILVRLGEIYRFVVCEIVAALQTAITNQQGKKQWV